MQLQLNEDDDSLSEFYKWSRTYSEAICESLSDEDIQAQSMPDASPLKWHLAHTTWAFETFILKRFSPRYSAFDKSFEYLFNSYYNAIGEQYPRPQRGLLTRPGRNTVMQYRQHVDAAMLALILKVEKNPTENIECINLIRLVINHEQQHQELMLTDLKHLLSFNPNHPVYADVESLSPCVEKASVTIDEGLYEIGHQNETFYFDNEGPSHPFHLLAFKIDTELVSNAEYLEFVQDDGYHRAEFWLSEAWYNLNQANQRAPLYWSQKNNSWYEYTLNGLKSLDPSQPVKHINYFEANAYAAWRGKRLPTEQEWEVAAKLHSDKLSQLFNQLWQWTSSSYSAYPGFTPAKGAIGEYNGKFMVNQYVLRGGSLATPKGHIRPSYRNFFYPNASWQFSGIRLAETI